MSKRRITFASAPTSTKTRTMVWVHDRAFSILGKGSHHVFLEVRDDPYDVYILVAGNPSTSFEIKITAKGGKTLKTYKDTIGSAQGYPIYDDLKVPDDD